MNNDSDEKDFTQPFKPISMGTVIGQYVIKRVIASGGMGTVFEALQENPRRPVAVKVIKSTLSGDSAIKRLEYEAQMLARLQHPGIAQIYEAGSYNVGDSAVPFFAMEYIANAKSISEYAANKKLSTRERLDLFLQVCDAIHHGHQRGIVHRDLKPSNILVDSNGRVKIIDFGVARATDADMKQAAAQTAVGQIVGSVQYMSPEQFDADPHDIDTRSDVYALGLVLYELLSGELPYLTDSDRLFDFASEVREGKTIPLGTKNKSFKGELEAIVHKALQRDREQRYQSAYGLAQDIRRFISGDAVVARRSGLSYQLQVFARRHKAIIGMVSAAFVILFAGVIITTSLLFTVEEERNKAEVASRRATEGQQFLSDVLTSAFPHGWGDGIKVLDILDRASQMLTGAFPDDPEIEANLRSSLGQAYLNIGHFDAAERELLTALGLSESSRGKYDDKTMAILDDLTLVYSVTNRTYEKLGIVQKLKSIIEQRDGTSRMDILDAQSSLVGALTDAGRITEARNLCETVWTDYKRHLGVDSIRTMHEQIQYAWLLLESGRTEEAEDIARDALIRAKKIAKSENSNLLRGAKGCLAGIFISKGQNDSAKAVYGFREIPDKFGIEKTFQGEFTLNNDPYQLLVFFETWCPYSRQAMVRLKEVDRQYRQFGLKIIGLTSVTKSSTDEAVYEYLKDENISFATFKENGRAWNYYNCDGTPSIRLLCNGYLIWEQTWHAPDRMPTKLLEGMVSAQTCGAIN